jgi:hypothetical protein
VSSSSNKFINDIPNHEREKPTKAPHLGGCEKEYTVISTTEVTQPKFKMLFNGDKVQRFLCTHEEESFQPPFPRRFLIVPTAYLFTSIYDHENLTLPLADIFH